MNPYYCKFCIYTSSQNDLNKIKKHQATQKHQKNKLSIVTYDLTIEEKRELHHQNTHWMGNFQDRLDAYNEVKNMDKTIIRTYNEKQIIRYIK